MRASEAFQSILLGMFWLLRARTFTWIYPPTVVASNFQLDSTMSTIVLIQSKWLFYGLFTVQVALKLQLSCANKVPWVVVFIPLLICDLSNISQKVGEIRGFFATNVFGSGVIALRQVACAIDYIGMFLGSVGLCVLLDTLQYSDSAQLRRLELRTLLPLCASPLWSSVLISTCIRLYSLRKMGKQMMSSVNLKSSIRPSGYYYSLLNMITQLTIRGLFSSLLVMRLMDIITDWSVVFLPLWVLVFLGIPLGVLSIARAPMAHCNSSTDLQKHAVRFIHITAMHIILFDIAAFVTLIWITQSLNTKDTLDDANTTAQQNPYPALFILSPLILLFFIFAALQPELLGRARNYQVW